MSIKFNCSNPECRRRIEVDETMASRAVPCPACGIELHVPDSTNIKFNCSNPECGQHIIVDVAEAGRVVRCPSCNKPLRVPGDPPMSILKSPLSAGRSDTDADPQLRSQTPVASAAAMLKRRFPVLQHRVVPRLVRLLAGWGAGAVIFGVIALGLYWRTQAALPKKLDAMAEEIYFTGELRDAPVVNKSETALLYAQDVKNGVGIFLEDLLTLQSTQIFEINAADKARDRAFKLFGWSPDERYLAFACVQSDNKDRQVVICDGSTGKATTNSFDLPDSIEQGFWLNARSLVLLEHSHALSLFNLEDGGFGKKGITSLRQSGSGGSYSVTPDSDHSIAYIDGGAIWSLDISSGRSVQLTHLTNSMLEWLDYNPANGKYLFCSTDNSKKRYVWQYDLHAQSKDAELIRLTDNYSFKGQWIQGNSGFAYVGTKGSKNFLGVRTEDPSLRTNLFTQGVARAYAVGPKRDKLYAIAALRNEPLNLWEYDIRDRQLRYLIPPGLHAATVSRFIVPVQESTTNASGEEVDYYMLAPAALDPHKKYPVLMDQFSDGRYQQNFQLLANAGIYYVTVNRYGMASGTRPTRPDDTLAVYRELLKNQNIDPRRIYIDGRSDGTIAVQHMLAEHPELWRGAIISSPLALPQIPPAGKPFPSSIFISVGDEDDLQLQAMSQRFLYEASDHLLRARVVFAHGAHTFSSTEQLKTRYKAIAKFIVTDF